MNQQKLPTLRERLGLSDNPTPYPPETKTEADYAAEQARFDRILDEFVQSDESYDYYYNDE
jgi:hypothetical protein